MRISIIVILVVLMLPSILLSGINIGIHPMGNNWIDNKDVILDRYPSWRDDIFGGGCLFVSFSYSFSKHIEIGAEGGYLTWYYAQYISSQIHGYSFPVFLTFQYNIDLKHKHIIPSIKFLYGGSLHLHHEDGVINGEWGVSRDIIGAAGKQTHIGINLLCQYYLSEFISIQGGLYLITNWKSKNFVLPNYYYSSFLLSTIGLRFHL